MQVVINTRQCPCRTLNDKCIISNDDCYEDDVCSFCPLIRNGEIELPKGHGRLIDADTLENYIKEDADEWDEYALAYLEDAPTIIEADKERANETNN